MGLWTLIYIFYLSSLQIFHNTADNSLSIIQLVKKINTLPIWQQSHDFCILLNISFDKKKYYLLHYTQYLTPNMNVSYSICNYPRNLQVFDPNFWKITSRRSLYRQTFIGKFSFFFRKRSFIQSFTSNIYVFNFYRFYWMSWHENSLLRFTSTWFYFHGLSLLRYSNHFLCTFSFLYVNISSKH